MSFHQQQQEKQEGNLSVASGNNNGVNLSNMPSSEGAVSDSRSPSLNNNNNNDKYFRDENHHRVLWMGDVSRPLIACFNNHSLMTLSLVFNRLMKTWMKTS
jgi:hypothetical protein